MGTKGRHWTKKRRFKVKCAGHGCDKMILTKVTGRKLFCSSCKRKGNKPKEMVLW